MKTILVTGANGFIGRHMTRRLLESGFRVRGAVRSHSKPMTDHSGYEQLAAGNLGPYTEWTSALQGVYAVVHLAARVHVMQEEEDDPEALYKRVNTLGTVQLAESAQRQGVERFLYLSTVKVLGAERERPYSEEDSPAPIDAYGRSKAEAEAALLSMRDMAITILRPPLVYGPGVKGNFFRLLEMVQRGFPLPLGLVRNARSMIYVRNLTDAALFCLTRPEAPYGAFLVKDGDDFSTPGIVREMARHMERPARLAPMPPSILKLAGLLLGKSPQVRRLVDSLRVDDSAIRQSGWAPPWSARDGIADTVHWFKGRKENP